MLCTKCSEVIRPVVAIDIDGTIGMYHEHFLKFAEAYMNKTARAWDYDGSIPFKRWFGLTYGVSDDVWHDIKLAYRQGGMKRSMPLYPYGRELCDSVIREGAELWITTTRPYIRHDNIDPDTREWLRRNRIVWHNLLYDGDKYKKLVQLVGTERIVAVLDDLTEELVGADASGIHVSKTILRLNKWNDNTSWVETAERLQLAEIMIKNRIERWNEQYANER